MRTLSLVIILAGLAHGDCIAVRADRIVAGDIAVSVPQFQALDPSTQVGFTPLPGTRRVISARELRSIAVRNGVSPGELIQDVCVERQVSPIDRDALEQALIESLGIDEARLELIDFSNQPVPQGRFEFRISALPRPSAAEQSGVIWRGRIVYDGERSFALWARVRITVNRPVFVATEDIAAGAVIRAEQVQSRIVRQMFPLSVAVESLDEIAGKAARRRIAAGQRIVPGLLEQPKDVLKGNQVHVRVIDGLASLSFDAVAEASGKTGDAILVHNPASGRNFRAVIEGKGQVIVRPGGGE